MFDGIVVTKVAKKHIPIYRSTIPKPKNTYPPKKSVRKHRSFAEEIMAIRENREQPDVVSSISNMLQMLDSAPFNSAFDEMVGLFGVSLSGEINGMSQEDAVRTMERIARVLNMEDDE